jgi:sugar transferase (PEP-CTERM/EpsH1 system associated)
MADILFLAHRIPYPPNKGDKIRSWNILKYLAARHRIHLGCLIDDPFDTQYIPELERHCATVFAAPIGPKSQRLKAMLGLMPGRPISTGYFHTAALSAWVRRTAEAHAIRHAFVFSTPMMASLPPERDLDIVLDMVDVDSEKWREMARKAPVPQRWIYAREARTLLAYERKAAARATETLFVSADELALFLSVAPEAAAHADWMANGVDTDYFSPAHRFQSPYTAARPVIAFTGDMSYWPNVEAVEWFAQAVLPLLLGRTPKPLFAIVGAKPTDAVRRLAGPDILVTGRVEDVRPYVAHAVLMVAPLLLARGIQNKVLEGMAMGKIVVATEAAERGLHVAEDGAVLVAADAPDMARLIGEVLDGRHDRVGALARRAALAKFSWDAQLTRLDVALGGAALPRAGAA